jgi:hypothetical protein
MVKPDASLLAAKRCVGFAITPCARYPFGTQPSAGRTLGIRAAAEEILDLGEKARGFRLGRTGR